MYTVSEMYHLAVMEENEHRYGYGDIEVNKFANEFAGVYTPTIFFENQEEVNSIIDMLEKSKGLKAFESLSLNDKQIVNNFLDALYWVDCDITPTVRTVSFSHPEEIKIIAFVFHSWLRSLRYDDLNSDPGAKLITRFIITLWHLISPVFRLEYDVRTDINDYTYEFNRPESLRSVVIPREWLPASIQKQYL